MVSTNMLYHHSVASLSWLSSKAQKEWNIGKSDLGWFNKCCNAVDILNCLSYEGVDLESSNWEHSFRFNMKR